MEVIKVTFFVLGTFFGIKDSRIVSEKATVSVDPEAKTVVVMMEDLFSIIKTAEDSLRADQELVTILENSDSQSPSVKNHLLKYCEFSPYGSVLNAKITLKYDDVGSLKDYALDVSEGGLYSFINIPSWDLKTSDGRLVGNYWQFNADEKFTFTLEPYKDLPEKYKVHKKSLLPMWEGKKGVRPSNKR